MHGLSWTETKRVSWLQNCSISSASETCRWKYEATNQRYRELEEKKNFASYNFLTPDMQYSEYAATTRLVRLDFIQFYETYEEKRRNKQIYLTALFSLSYGFNSHVNFDLVISSTHTALCQFACVHRNIVAKCQLFGCHRLHHSKIFHLRNLTSC